MKISVFTSESKIKVPNPEVKFVVSGSGAKPESNGTLKIKIGKGRTIVIERTTKENGKSKVSVEFLGKGRKHKTLAAAIAEVEKIEGFKLPAKIKADAKKFITWKINGKTAKANSGLIVKDKEVAQDAKLIEAINAAGLPKSAKGGKFTQSFFEGLFPVTNMSSFTAAQVKALGGLLNKVNDGKKPTAKELEVLKGLRGRAKSKGVPAIKGLKHDVKTRMQQAINGNVKKDSKPKPTSGTQSSSVTGITQQLASKGASAILETSILSKRQIGKAINAYTAFISNDATSAQIKQLHGLLELIPDMPKGIASKITRMAASDSGTKPKDDTNNMAGTKAGTNVVVGNTSMMVPDTSPITPAGVKKILTFVDSLNIPVEADQVVKGTKALIKGTIGKLTATRLLKLLANLKADGVKGTPAALVTALKNVGSAGDPVAVPSKDLVTSPVGNINFNVTKTPLSQADVKRSLTAFNNITRGREPAKAKVLVKGLQDLVNGTLTTKKAVQFNKLITGVRAPKALTDAVANILKSGSKVKITPKPKAKVFSDGGGSNPVSFLGTVVNVPKRGSLISEADTKKAIKVIADLSKSGNSPRRKRMIDRLQHLVNDTMTSAMAKKFLEELGSIKGLPRSVSSTIKAIAKESTAKPVDDRTPKSGISRRKK